MRQNFTNQKERSKVAPLAKTLMTGMKVTMKLILHHLVIISGNPIFKLDHLNPMNMKVDSI